VSNDTLTAIVARLRELLTWQDGWNSYDALAPDPDAVSRAEQWITEFYQRITSLNLQWIEPNITGGGDGEVIFTWYHGQRDINVYIDKQEIGYLQAWSRGVNTRLTDGDINTIEDMQQL
jgi:hypothetical protein